MDSPLPGPDLAAAIAAWRARGAEGFDPVRFRLIEAMARRSAAHHGLARRLLDDKVARLLAAYGEEFDRRAGAGAPPASPAPPPAPPEGSALAELVDRLVRHAPQAGDGTAAPAELKALRYFRRTWSRLSARQRLVQALATVPENAGPLNSQHLVHRALTVMRDGAPDYLSRFMAHVDALLWLEQAAAPAPRPPRR